MKISIVSPVFRGEDLVSELVSQIKLALSDSYEFELILVDDRSPDKSWEKILKICRSESKVKGIRLSKNFGQHHAITAGLKYCTGEIIVVMDCDLQDNPIDILKLVEEYKKGNEIVFTKRLVRKQSKINNILVFLYNKLFLWLSDTEMDVNIGTMVLFTNKVKKVFLEIEEQDRLYIYLLKWLGFTSTVVTVNHQERLSGKSNYTFKMLLSLAVRAFTSHSQKLLRYNIIFGVLLATISMLLGFMVLVQYFILDLQPGWPSIIIAILFSTGIILISSGILGVYIGKIFTEVKKRPIFIVESEINL